MATGKCQARKIATALSSATNDPADAVRLLLPLCTWQPKPLFGGGPLAQAIAQTQAALVRNLHCAALAALAQASAAYRPISYQDALSLRSIVCAAIDAEATLAADAGDNATYDALRNLRVAVAIDLAYRGANLPALVNVETLVSMPSLVEVTGRSAGISIARTSTPPIAITLHSTGQLGTVRPEIMSATRCASV